MFTLYKNQHVTTIICNFTGNYVQDYFMSGSCHNHKLSGCMLLPHVYNKPLSHFALSLKCAGTFPACGQVWMGAGIDILGYSLPPIRPSKISGKMQVACVVKENSNTAGTSTWRVTSVWWKTLVVGASESNAYLILKCMFLKRRHLLILPHLLLLLSFMVVGVCVALQPSAGVFLAPSSPTLPWHM